MNILQHQHRFKEYGRSVQLSCPLSLFLPEAELKQQQIMQQIKKEGACFQIKKTKFKSELNINEICSIDLASEKGASSWLNAMPLKRYQFHLTKSEFHDDGIALLYGWDPDNMASLCTGNENFTVAHALHCPKEGYTHMRNNGLRDSFANLIFSRCKGKPLLFDQRLLMIRMQD